MSVSDKEISSVGDSGVVGVSGSGGDDPDDDDDDDKKKKSGVHQDIDDHNSFSGFSRKLGKAKKLVLRPFNRKLSKKLGSHIKAASSSSCFSGKRNGDDVNKSCCFCFTTNPSGESGIGSRSQSIDPNHPTFTYDMVRVLMETSDFYSKECNTHLDSEVSFAED
ncbi:hypothetical protein L484_022678 [Morus notabilis]|uniref:Uncharacterized protein n=1 Tax=Morus notabilis TaxID=981085 RepID=W9QXX5_9ROSA|nr:uncharacterized protein LOC21405487 [Morus notabilis]EXB57571.1 hypothetical protein L484_022678 [Morus notabilis]